MKLLHVVGARPNYPKLAPVWRAARDAGLEQIIVDTGQHYDDALAGAFLRDLGLPEPDVRLGVGSASHAVQTARIMEGFEPVLVAHRPDWLVVYGDVNSTLAASVVAAKLGVRIAHVEAGLRSGDRSMPEEINRLVTDRLADLLLTPSRDAAHVLRGEGEPDDEVVFVGNVMIDTLLHSLSAARRTGYGERLRLRRGAAVLVTLHRPSNVDDRQRFGALAAALRDVAADRPVIFPVHPRTRARIDEFGLDFGAVQLLQPIAYFEMLDLVDGAHAVVTDSGGLQEESTALGVPCFTLRDNTERPITVTEGTNQLVHEPTLLPALVRAASRAASTRRPDGWDGRAAERVVAALIAGWAIGRREALACARTLARRSLHRRLSCHFEALKTIILAGGLGTRLAEETVLRPKPMVEIGERPILWHLMRFYASFGHRHFVLALGYKGEVVKEYFLNFYALNSSLTVELGGGRSVVHGGDQLVDWTVDLVDTGLHTQTGGRLKRASKWVGQETCMAAYGDGLSDVNIDALVAFHRAHGKLATVTAVRPPSRFGGLAFDGDRVTHFLEKPQTGEGWINGGFFVFEPGVFDYVDGDDTVFERGPLERLAADGQLMAFRHGGFFQPMDTLREKQLLESLWTAGKAPWAVEG